jgi:hypothetical protein
MKLRDWIVGTSTVLCVAQVAILAARHRSPVGPTVGRRLPDPGPIVFRGQGVLPWSRIVTDGHGCTLMVFVDPGCGACQRMRDSWSADLSRWTDSVRAPVRAIWVTAGDSATVQRFTTGFHLGETTVARFVGDVAVASHRLGIYGTPTLYLVDRAGVLRVGVLGDGLPPVDSGRAACRSS